MALPDEFSQEAEADRRAVRAFKQAVRASDMEAFSDAIALVEVRAQWRAALLAAAKLDPSTAFRRFFLDLYADSGDSLRSCVNDDRVLVRGFRALMPVYRGPGMRLWRGASAEEGRYRCYGHAWTSDRAVARDHAANVVHGGRGIVLETDAPAIAIVSAPHLEITLFQEREFVVDRSKLGQVRIIERDIVTRR